MMDRVLELFAKGWAVEVGSYYGSHMVEDAEEIRDTFEEVEDDEYLSLEVEFFEQEHRIELFMQDDE